MSMKTHTFFIFHAEKNIFFCCNLAETVIMQRPRAGGRVGVYVYVYTETHRLGKLSVNHKSNW